MMVNLIPMEWMVVIGAIAFILGFVTVVSRSKAPPEKHVYLREFDNLDPNSRSVLMPVRRLSIEIIQLLEKHSLHPILSALRYDLESKIEHTAKQSIQLSKTRRELIRMRKDQPNAQIAIENLQSQLSRTQDEEKRKQLEDNLETRSKELQNYQQFESEQQKIEQSFRDMETALAELKSRLLVAISASHQDASEETSALISRMKSLSDVVQDSTEILQTESW
jgi:hypothetical protein